MKRKVDAVVLGAGIVGVSTALHLAQRGEEVVLVDKRGAGEETSFGNAGLIQREGVLPHAFPRDWLKLARHASNLSIDSHYHLRDLPRIAPFLARYWWHSAPKRYAEIVRSYSVLIAQAVQEHEALILAAGAEALVAKEGWYKLFRSGAARDKAFAEAEWLNKEYGINSETLGGAEVSAREPDMIAEMAGAIHWLDPWTVKDPLALTQAYLSLFTKLGGTFEKGDAMSLEEDGRSWTVSTQDGVLAANQAVIALGPWSDVLTQKLGYRLPLAVKRGYHMHYGAQKGARLRNWLLDAEVGYLLAPVNAGIRLTTGAEFASRDAAADAGAARQGREDCARGFSPGRAAGKGPLDGCTPLHARHDADHRRGTGARTPLVRVRPCPSRPDAGAGDWTAAFGNDDGDHAFRGCARLFAQPFPCRWRICVRASSDAGSSIGASARLKCRRRCGAGRHFLTRLPGAAVPFAHPDIDAAVIDIDEVIAIGVTAQARGDG